MKSSIDFRLDALYNAAGSTGKTGNTLAEREIRLSFPRKRESSIK